MHPEARAAVERIASELGYRDRTDISVLDIGGRNINGWLRDLFAASDWTTLDINAAPEVDIVADARTWQPPRRWDLVLCTEVLEHVYKWPAVVATAAKATAEGGALILTCASTGRPPHSQTGAADIPDGEHYANVAADDLDWVMSGLFTSHHVEYAYPPGDVYAWGRRSSGATSEAAAMEYDKGGTLPSGLDGAVNLAGPESVLTAPQWAELGNRYIQDHYVGSDGSDAAPSA